jgi:hypothetical protein
MLKQLYISLICKSNVALPVTLLLILINFIFKNNNLIGLEVEN